MDIVLLIVSSLFILLGLVGCLLPVLPGPPLSYVGLLLLHFTSWVDVATSTLIWLAFFAVLVTVLDYVIPIYGTKKFGGSKQGQWGATIGLIVGLFFGPLGIILGPFVGALVGEFIIGRSSQEAFKSAFGSFLGFLTGVVLKLVVSGIITYVFVQELWGVF
jgi:uncharacterized protein YqgC (DUF456 family)